MGLKGDASRVAMGVLLGIALALIARSAVAAEPSLDVKYAEAIPNARHPSIVYWFFAPNSLQNDQYLNDLDRFAKDTPFTFLYLTARNGVNFTNDLDRLKPVLAKLVDEAHKRGLKVGWQLSGIAAGSYTTADAVALVTEGKGLLDANGKQEYWVTTGEARGGRAIESEVLRVFAFHETSDGFYDPATLVDITQTGVKNVTSSAPGTLSLSIDAGVTHAGQSVYVMVSHYFAAADLFSNRHIDQYRRMLTAVKDIPFDGTALDEFGNMRINQQFPVTNPFRDRFYGKSFAKAFEQKIGRSLEQTLFDMRFAPTGKPEVRMRAINQYWDVFRQGPLRIEQDFYDFSKKTFGPNTFAAVHATFHNRFTNDEPWADGIDWWEIPREYGQSDEDLPLAERMGLLVANKEPVMIDMFYGWDIPRFASKAIRDARFGARIHYHGYNDVGTWGADLSKADFLDVINPVEQKIRLLNHFDPAAPRLPLLIVFGMPAYFNWYPNEKDRSTFDINGSVAIEEKSAAVWNAGYPCALVPSQLIDLGRLKLDERNRPVMNGHTFGAVIYLYPEYAKQTSLDFLEKFANGGGRLMIEGDATHDFSGNDITSRFKAIAAKATVQGFDVSKIPELGVKKEYPTGEADGWWMEDGAVVLTDLPSIQEHKPKAFAVTLANHTFTGTYTGIMALKVDRAGAIEKFACGEFSELQRDGRNILSVAHPADIVISKRDDGGYRVLLKGRSGDNSVNMIEP